MRQAITTKYLGPTNADGSRILADADAGRITVPWDHALGVYANHRNAAEALLRELGWNGPGYGPWFGGSTAYGYCFVDTSDASDAFTDANV